jgi:hypothetical protein
VLRRAPLAEQELVQIPIARNCRADVAGADRLAALDQVRDPPRLEELGDDRRIGRLMRGVLREWESALGHHSLDQCVDLRQRLGRRVDDERLQRLPLALPFVSVEPGFDHVGKHAHDRPL